MIKERRVQQRRDEFKEWIFFKVPNGFWSLKGREGPQRLRGVEEEREWDGGTRSGRDLRKID
jgi:hypothetical protein